MGEDLKGIFDGSKLSTAATRIVDVALNNTYTLIGDPNHTQAAPYELISKPETLHALKSAGVKHIAVEMLTPAETPLLEAYERGEISDRTMEYVITKMDGPSLVEDKLGLDDTIQNKTYFDLVRNAKEAGIKMHGVNGSEGVLSAEESDILHKEIGDMKLTMAKAIEDNPEFFDMKRIDQGNFMTKSLYDAGYNNTEVRMGLVVTGFRKQSFPELTEDLILNRLEADPLVAERIKNVTGGEKSVVIYGNVHYLQRYGGIDESLPDSKTVDIYADKAAYDRTVGPTILMAEKMLGIDLGDKADYFLDIKSGTWMDNSAGTAAKVQIPDLDSIIPMPEPKPEIPTPFSPGTEKDIKMTPALPDIKF